MRQVQCEGCGESTPDYDIVSYGTTGQGYRQLCSGCFNAEMARHTGHEGFANASFEPVGMVDRAGERHEFHFQTRLLGDVVALDAFELRDGVRTHADDFRGLAVQAGDFRSERGSMMAVRREARGLFALL